ncbi:heterokaryon incompatibility protein-domain-containing protein [Daedaleopsis nitida]|nr:heterokaryon incompatibility protein-domain-containing protein [Daedaleopsis nitida]
MWLLHSQTLELKSFVDPTRVKYAILSHVWEDADHTVTFRDIQEIHARCLRSGEDPRMLVTEKVRQFALLAEREGFNWIWLDTCCIDKSSSAELSEAINSMYAWYKEAAVCYAYLGDIDDFDDPRAPNSQFRRSRWHTRGWTLQELIAPRYVIFLSRKWHTVGSKLSLIQVVTEVSGIDVNILVQLFSKANLDAVCIARRMSWAAKRETTRVEDHAYSLLGLFGISMPIIYGEGLRSFLRLQMEIVKAYPRDHSIFAWGRIHEDFDAAHEGIEWPNMEVFSRDQKERRKLAETISARVRARSLPRFWHGLLAPSPSVFADSAHIKCHPSIYYQHWYGEDIPTKCTFTGHHVLLRLPVSTDHTTCRPYNQRLIRAIVLACGTSRYTSASIIGSASIVLFLDQCSSQSSSVISGDIGTWVIDATRQMFCRGAVLPHHDYFPADFKMQKVKIFNEISHSILELSHSAVVPSFQGASSRLQDLLSRPYIFFIPMWNVMSLKNLYNCELTIPAGSDGEDGARLVLRSYTRLLDKRLVEGEAFDRVGRLQLVIPQQGSDVDILWIDFCVGCPCFHYYSKDATEKSLILPWQWWLSAQWSQSNGDGTQKSYSWQRLGQNPMLFPMRPLHFIHAECPRAHIHMLMPRRAATEPSAPTSLISSDGHRVIRLRFATFWDDDRRFVETEPSQIMMLIELEGFKAASRSGPPGPLQIHRSPESSPLVASDSVVPESLPVPPLDLSVAPAQPSPPAQTSNTPWYWTPTVAYRYLRDSQGLRSLVGWLVSEVDYSYGSLV